MTGQDHATPAGTGAAEGGRPGGQDASGSALLGTITLRVQRYRPDRDDRPHLVEYEVPWGQDTSVLDALTWIKDRLDPTLTFRWSCRMAICGSCGFMLDGVPKLGCEQFVRDYAPGPLTVEPLANLAVERDLVVDLEPFLASLTAVKPWVVPDPDDPVTTGTHRQTPEQLLAFHDYAMCVNCLLCYAACPQVGLSGTFLGPAALATAVRYDQDSRDHGADLRLPVVDTEDGLWSCTFIGECSTACPKGVDPAAAIQQAKAAAAAAWAAEYVLPRRGGGR